MCRRMIEEGSKRGKALVEKRQLFMEMSECSRLRGRAPAALSALCHGGLVSFFELYGILVVVVVVLPHTLCMIPPTQCC